MMSKRRGAFSAIAEWVGVFLIAFAVFALVRTFVVSPYVVPSGSMLPTIQVGDSIFAQKVTTRLGMDPADGDIVVFDNPVPSSEHAILVKRVIAHAGQTVDLVDGAVYVDGQRLDEPCA